MNCPKEFGIDDAALSEITVPTIIEQVRSAEEAVLRTIERQPFREDDLFAMKLALEEALVNAIRHGNGSDPTKNVTIKYHISPLKVVIGIGDEGQGFRPDLLPDPTLDENLDKPHGRGVMLMKAYMTQVCFNDRGNEVWMLKTMDAS